MSRPENSLGSNPYTRYVEEMMKKGGDSVESAIRSASRSSRNNSSRGYSKVETKKATKQKTRTKDRETKRDKRPTKPRRTDSARRSDREREDKVRKVVDKIEAEETLRERDGFVRQERNGKEWYYNEQTGEYLSTADYKAKILSRPEPGKLIREGGRGSDRDRDEKIRSILDAIDAHGDEGSLDTEANQDLLDFETAINNKNTGPEEAEDIFSDTADSAFMDVTNQYRQMINDELARGENQFLSALGQSQLQNTRDIAKRRQMAIKSGMSPHQLASQEMQNIMVGQRGATQMANDYNNNRFGVLNSFYGNTQNNAGIYDTSKMAYNGQMGAAHIQADPGFTQITNLMSQGLSFEEAYQNAYGEGLYRDEQPQQPQGPSGRPDWAGNNAQGYGSHGNPYGGWFNDKGQ